jgi:cell fate regulator YaaT (PSP1 superfamily)
VSLFRSNSNGGYFILSGQHLVRIGILGQIGRMAVADAVRYPRRTRVICRTVRGLEVGEVLSAVPAEEVGAEDGLILRGVTIEDDLLLERLERKRHDAFLACERLLNERGVGDVLIDVEQLFDGESLYFYFLGEPSAAAAQLTQELAEAYDTQAQIRQFADTLTSGCGPGCGTQDAEKGCDSGSGGCSTCAVLSACVRR